MKIYNNGVMIYENNSCTGCMCHDLNMIFGNDKDICAECGCPKTLKGVQRLLVKNDTQENSSKR